MANNTIKYQGASSGWVALGSYGANASNWSNILDNWKEVRVVMRDGDNHITGIFDIMTSLVGNAEHTLFYGAYMLSTSFLGTLMTFTKSSISYAARYSDSGATGMSVNNLQLFGRN